MKINRFLMVTSSTPVGLAILAEEDNYRYASLQSVRALSGKPTECADGMLSSYTCSTERSTGMITSTPIRARLIVEASP